MRLMHIVTCDTQAVCKANLRSDAGGNNTNSRTQHAAVEARKPAVRRRRHAAGQVCPIQRLLSD